MFKRNDPGGQLDIFDNVYHQVSPKIRAKLEDPKGWHNIFFRQVLCRISEPIFGVLFSAKKGRNNAPVNVLVAMMILKEGNNWTDEQLFDEVNSNIKVRLALGLNNWKEDVPCPSTYYNFRKRIVEYDEEHGTDLLGESFKQLAQYIAKAFSIKGSKVRMDSKLFSSNIAKSTRLQLIVKSLRKWLRENGGEDVKDLSETSQQVLARVAKYQAERFTFRMTKDEEKEWLVKFGLVIKEIVDRDKDSTGLLTRILAEQYNIVEKPPKDSKEAEAEQVEGEERLELKSREEIDGKTLQSPYDPEATYRRKENGAIVQTVRGYTTNVTETCTPGNPFNIITSVQTETATYSDDKFFQQAVETSREVLDGEIEEVITDGGYHSTENVAYAEGGKDTDSFVFHTQAIPGPDGYFDYQWVGGKLKVTDKRTGKSYIATKTDKGKYRIKISGQYRYILPKTITNYFRRKEIEENKHYITSTRANVESTIHQVFHTLNGKKSKYRGKKKNHFYAVLRSFWANFKRMAKYIENAPKEALNAALFALNIGIKWLLTLFRCWWRELRLQTETFQN